MKRFSMGRRAVLRGLGGVALGLPLLDVMRAHGQTAAPPKRFVVFFSPNGTCPPQWRPVGTETSFTFGPILAPLTPFKSKMLVLSGVDVPCQKDSPGEGHLQGMGCMLTGAPLQPGDAYGDDVSRSNGADGISIDQEIANRIGGATKFRSLEFGVQVSGPGNSDTPYSRMCYSGPNQTVPAMGNPQEAFDRVFFDLNPGPSPDVARLRRRRHSVLDSVSASIAALNKKVSLDDRKKLDAHFTAVSELEKRLDLSGQVGGTCSLPELGPTAQASYSYLNDQRNFPEIGKHQMDLLVMALACDRTRVASIQWSNAVSGQFFSWLGATEDHHTLSHGNYVDDLVNINIWYAQQLAYLVGKMAQVPEGDGTTMLDNSVVLWVNDLGVGWGHSHTDIPFVMVGSAGGYFRTGRHVTYGNLNHDVHDHGYGVPHNNLFVSLLNAMGEEVTTFGYPEFCTGPLSNLT